MDCSCHSFNASLSFFHHPLSLSIKPTLSLSFCLFPSFPHPLLSCPLVSCFPPTELSPLPLMWQSLFFKDDECLYISSSPPALLHSHPGKNRTLVDRIKQCRFLYTDWHNLWIPERNLMSINKQIWRYFRCCEENVISMKYFDILM